MHDFALQLCYISHALSSLFLLHFTNPKKNTGRWQRLRAFLHICRSADPSAHLCTVISSFMINQSYLFHLHTFFLFYSLPVNNKKLMLGLKYGFIFHLTSPLSGTFQLDFIFNASSLFDVFLFFFSVLTLLKCRTGNVRRYCRFGCVLFKLVGNMQTLDPLGRHLGPTQ